MNEVKENLCDRCEHHLLVKFANGAVQRKCLLGVSLYGAENVTECTQFKERKHGKAKVSTHASRGRSDMGKMAETE